MRIAIDTNVLIAALTKPRGRGARIVKAWLDGHVQVVVSEATLREAELVLSGRWLGQLTSQREVEGLLEQLRIRAVRVGGRRINDLRLKDAGDLRLVEAAVDGGAEYLVTTDRELLRQRGYCGTEFVTPAEFVKVLDGMQRQ